MRLTYYILLFLLSSCFIASGQMHLHGDTLLGNEWIDYDKTYYRLDVAHDDLHKVTGDVLEGTGVSLQPGEKWQLWFMGEEVPLYVSDETDFDSDDEIIFYGYKNRNGLDSLLYLDKKEQLNPRYSIITDTSAYYLTKTRDDPQRMTLGAIAPPTADEALKSYRRTFRIDSNSLFHSDYLRDGTIRFYGSEFDKTVGFSSIHMSRYFETITLPDHFYTADSTVKFGFHLAADYNSRFDDLAVRYQLSTNILENDTLNSFEIASREFDVPQNSNGQYIIALSRLDHSMQRLFMVSNLWIKYLSSFILHENKIQYTIAAKNKNVHLVNNEIGADYFIADLFNKEYNIINAASDTIKYSHTKSYGEYHIQKLDEIRNIATITSVKLSAPKDPTATIFTIVTSKKLYAQMSSPNYIDDYVDFRLSEAGGKFDTRLHFIEDLYDEYGYGVRRHPITLNNFSEELRRQDDQGHLLIIGKGRSYTTLRTEEELHGEDNETFYVPSYGFPASDPLAVSPIGQISPRISTGRLAVSNIDEVGIYLNNVKQYEASAATIPSENPNWKKKIIHLSGGNELAGPVRNILENMAKRIEQTEYAPEVKTYYKNSTVPVDSSLSGQIYNQVNSGVSIVTFLGHSAPNTLGFSVENEKSYSNAPLFPLFIALGCRAGNYNIPGTSVGEVYCLMENKGFLNLIASSGISILYNLDSVGRNLYEFIGDHGNELSQGQLFGSTISKIAPTNRLQAAQLSLFGDPSIRLNLPKEKDVTVDASSVRTSTDILGADKDSFDFKFDILNMGLAPDIAVGVQVTRQYPSGDLAVLYEGYIDLKGYRTEIDLLLALERDVAIGQNRIFITLDNENQIDEKLYPYSELNNQYIHSDNKAGFPIFIPNNTLVPIWPRDEAIVPNSKITFMASSGDLLAADSKYYFEIDTSASFSSPAYKSINKNSGGGVVSFDPDYNFQSNLVYYWRISPSSDPITGELFWSDPQSFIIIPDKEGWNISHYYQFLKTNKIGLNLTDNRAWEFDKYFIPVRFRNGIWDPENITALGWIEQNNNLAKKSSLAWEVNQEALAVIAYDHADRHLLNPIGGKYGSIPVDREVEYFAFENTIPGRDSLIAFVEQVVPGDYNILFFTVRNKNSGGFESMDWSSDSLRNNGTNLFNLFEGYGATVIRDIQLSDSVNYMGLFHKSKAPKFEEITFDDEEYILGWFNVLKWNHFGRLSLSTDIMKNEAREVLKWKFQSDLDTFDQYSIAYQYPQSSYIKNIATNEIEGSYNVYLASDSIKNSSEFWADISDNNLTNPAPVRPDYFRIHGDLIGDFALAPNLSSSSLQALYRTFEPVIGRIAVVNIEHAENNIEAKVFARNLTNNTEYIFSNTTIDVPTNGQFIIEYNGVLTEPGDYLLTVEINDNRAFEEAYYFNNVIQIPLTVLADNAPPLLDVTFDKRTIANNQLVSPTSIIEVHLTDENDYLYYDDIRYLDVVIIRPDSSIYPIVNGQNATYTLPVTGTSNRLGLILESSFEQEGIYHLLVTGEDRSNNKNQISYQVDFRISKSNAFGAYVFPNPAVDRLNIAYMLLGELPDEAEVIFTNALGQTIASTALPIIAGQNQLTIGIPASWPIGRYQYEILLNGKRGGDYPAYIDAAAGFKNGGSTGQFILVREN